MSTFIHIAAIGVGATLVLDTWALLLKRLGVPVLDYALLGRLIGHLARGRRPRGRITDAAPVKGEGWMGWSLHYAIGIFFASLLVGICGRDWMQAPTLGPALIVGVATAVAPLLVLQPALGAGIAASKTPQPLLNSLKSVLSHAIFGIGLYLAGWVSTGVFR